MSERNYYVLCENNCKFPAMTKEQILAAIAEATDNIPSNVDSAFITKIKELNGNNNLSFWVGTQAEYNALTQIEENRLYIISNTGDDIEEMREAILDLQTNIEDVACLANDAMTGISRQGVVLWEGNERVMMDGLTIHGIEWLSSYKVLAFVISQQGLHSETIPDETTSLMACIYDTPANEKIFRVQDRIRSVGGVCYLNDIYFNYVYWDGEPAYINKIIGIM